MKTALWISVFMASTVAACTDTPAADEFEGESDADGEIGKGDASASPSFNFLELRVDSRRCIVADGECGVGFYVSRPNRSTTQCGRGSVLPECKVYTVDWRGTAMPASVAKSYEDRVRAGEHVLVRGSILPGANDAKASLAVSEIWVGSEREPGAGVFALVKDNGIRCVRAPCPSLTELKVNSTLSAKLTAVDFEASGASAAAIELASNQLFDNGVVVVGYRDSDGHGGKVRTANTFYTRAPVPLH